MAATTGNNDELKRSLNDRFKWVVSSLRKLIGTSSKRETLRCCPIELESTREVSSLTCLASCHYQDTKWDILIWFMSMWKVEGIFRFEVFEIVAQSIVKIDVKWVKLLLVQIGLFKTRRKIFALNLSKLRYQKALRRLGCTKAREKPSKHNLNDELGQRREKFPSINQNHETKALKRKKSIMAWMVQNVLNEQKSMKCLSLN